MATAADRKKWDALHAKLAAAADARLEYEIELGRTYGRHFELNWLKAGQRNKLEKLRDKERKISREIVDLIVRISPRGEAWLSGVPSWWLSTELTWEDVVRPKNEPLSVVTPGGFNFPPGSVKERMREEHEYDETERVQSDLRTPPFAPIMKSVKPITGKLTPAQARVLAKYDGVELPFVSKAPIYGFRPNPPSVEHKILLGLILGGRMRVFQVSGPLPGNHPPSTTGSHANYHYRLSSAENDGHVKESRKTPRRTTYEGHTMEITIPEMDWTQVSGDMNPGTYGAIIATGDGSALELIEIQPVREYVGDGEAEEVGFPFWSKEAYYTLDDLDPEDKDTKAAIDSMDLWDALEEMSPTQRAVAIAEALMRYGVGADEGPAGWSQDVLGDRKVKWWTGAVAGAEYIADEDEEFRREILGEEDEEEEEDEE